MKKLAKVLAFGWLLVFIAPVIALGVWLNGVAKESKDLIDRRYL